jgi:hypothetical protein
MPAAAAMAPGREAYASVQVDPMTSTTLWAPDNSSPLALLPHGFTQLVSQCQEPTTTHISEPQAPRFTILLSGGPAFPTVPDSKRALALLSGEGNL